MLPLYIKYIWESPCCLIVMECCVHYIWFKSNALIWWYFPEPTYLHTLLSIILWCSEFRSGTKGFDCIHLAWLRRSRVSSNPQTETTVLPNSEIALHPVSLAAFSVRRLLAAPAPLNPTLQSQIGCENRSLIPFHSCFNRFVSRYCFCHIRRYHHFIIYRKCQV